MNLQNLFTYGTHFHVNIRRKLKMGKLLGLVASMPPWFLIGISLVLVYIVLKRRSKSRNPFVTSLPQPTPVELDPKERDKVLRQNFKVRKCKDK